MIPSNPGSLSTAHHAPAAIAGGDSGQQLSLEQQKQLVRGMIEKLSWQRGEGGSLVLRHWIWKKICPSMGGEPSSKTDFSLLRLLKGDTGGMLTGENTIEEKRLALLLNQESCLDLTLDQIYGEAPRSISFEFSDLLPFTGELLEYLQRIANILAGELRAMDSGISKNAASSRRNIAEEVKRTNKNKRGRGGYTQISANKVSLPGSDSSDKLQRQLKTTVSKLNKFSTFCDQNKRFSTSRSENRSHLYFQYNCFYRELVSHLEGLRTCWSHLSSTGLWKFQVERKQEEILRTLRDIRVQAMDLLSTMRGQVQVEGQGYGENSDGARGSSDFPPSPEEEKMDDWLIECLRCVDTAEKKPDKPSPGRPTDHEIAMAQDAVDSFLEELRKKIQSLEQRIIRPLAALSVQIKGRRDQLCEFLSSEQEQRSEEWLAELMQEEQRKLESKKSPQSRITLSSAMPIRDSGEACEQPLGGNEREESEEWFPSSARAGKLVGAQHDDFVLQLRELKSEGECLQAFNFITRCTIAALKKSRRMHSTPPEFVPLMRKCLKEIESHAAYLGTSCLLLSRIEKERGLNKPLSVLMPMLLLDQAVHLEQMLNFICLNRGVLHSSHSLVDKLGVSGLESRLSESARGYVTEMDRAIIWARYPRHNRYGARQGDILRLIGASSDANEGSAAAIGRCQERLAQHFLVIGELMSVIEEKSLERAQKFADSLQEFSEFLKRQPLAFLGPEVGPAPLGWMASTRKELRAHERALKEIEQKMSKMDLTEVEGALENVKNLRDYLGRLTESLVMEGKWGGCPLFAAWFYRHALLWQFALEQSYELQARLEGYFFSWSHDLKKHTALLGICDEAEAEGFCFDRGVYYPHMLAHTSSDTDVIVYLRHLQESTKNLYLGASSTQPKMEIGDYTGTFYSQAEKLIKKRMAKLSRCLDKFHPVEA